MMRNVEASKVGGRLEFGTVHQLRAECDTEILSVVFRSRKY